MTDKQFEKFLEAVAPKPKTGIEKWNEVIKFWLAVVSLAASVYLIVDYRNVKDELEMMKAYFSGQQSKYAEMIGILRGQGDKRTADILEILREQNERELNKFSDIKYEGKEKK